MLKYGDDTAVHVGGKGGLRVAGAVMAPAWPAEVLDADRQWLGANGRTGMVSLADCA